MVSPRKKQKTMVVVKAKELTPTNIFQAPGLQPDVRLKVFDDEFIVHSQILKLYSAFFRRFLDSPDKQLNHDSGGPDHPTGRIGVVLPSKYKYEWVTVVDDDDNDDKWHLVAASNVNEDSSEFSLSEVDQESETRAFERLLCAMYMKPYEIQDVADLRKLVGLAGYYCALPVLSRSLDGALMRSQAFVKSIPTACLEILELSFRLRHEVLYKESLAFVVGQYECPLYHALHPPLHDIAKRRYNELAAEILKVERGILNELLFAEGHKSRRILEMLKTARYDDEDVVESPNFMATYMREVFEEGQDAELSALCLNNIGDLISNTTTLSRHMIVGGQVDEEACPWFLCVHKSSEPLPWDISETDW